MRWQVSLMDPCKTSCRCWEPNLGSLEEKCSLNHRVVSPASLNAVLNSHVFDKSINFTNQRLNVYTIVLCRYAYSKLQGQLWWLTLEIPVLRRLRQEDCYESEDCLSIMRSFLKNKTTKTINTPHIKHKLCTMTSSWTNKQTKHSGQQGPQRGFTDKWILCLWNRQMLQPGVRVNSSSHKAHTSLHPGYDIMKTVL